MMMDAVLAVALGVVPVETPSAVTVHVRPTQMVKAYKQRVDRSGRVHLRGVDPRTGVRYYVTVSNAGQVRGWVGQRYVSFRAFPAS